MIHDQDLVDRLSELATDRFEGEIFRATRIGADPMAPSISGGRWAPPPTDTPGIYVLYSSLERFLVDRNHLTGIILRPG